MLIEEVVQKSKEIRNSLLVNIDVDHRIDAGREYIPVPKIGKGPIKIIFIGQDPTVKRKESRDKIKTVLNLDKRNSLYRYLHDIAKGLHCDIEENIYATNLLKCFYEVPPATIPNFVKLQTPYWIDLLKFELKQYPDAKIITLGEPLLQSLTFNGSTKVKDYWGYKGKNQADTTQFNYCRANNNLLERIFFPLPHQPSIRKEFYKNYLEKYIDFVNTTKV